MKRKLRSYKLLLNLYQIHTFLIYYPLFAIISSFLFGITLITSLLFGEKARAKTTHRLARVWARVLSFLVPMFTRIRGLENLKKGQSYVIIANHQSQADIAALYGWLPVDFRWVMKIELKKAPVIGPACKNMGHIFVDRSNTKAALESIYAVKEVIKDGTCIIFFPEGTRSHDGSLLPFKHGAFHFALNLKLPILPISIVGSREIIPNGSKKIFPGIVTLVIHPPINTETYTDDSIKDLIQEGRTAIQYGLDTGIPLVKQ